MILAAELDAEENNERKTLAIPLLRRIVADLESSSFLMLGCAK